MSQARAEDLDEGGSNGGASSSATTTASSPNQLSTVVIQGQAFSSTEIAQREVDQVAGGTALITSEDFANQKLTNIADIFDYQPGVNISQSADFGQAPKISIRGSGINKGWSYWLTGVEFFFDDLPLTGPNGTPTNFWNPYDVSYAQVYKGSNGLVNNGYGLGGSINFAMHTAPNAYPFQARVDVGSFGLEAGQVSTGLVEGNADAYLSAVAVTDQNYAGQSAANSYKLSGNFGYQITPDIEDRFYFRFADNHSQINTGITKYQVLHDPTNGGSSAAQFDTDLYPASFWMGNKTTVRLDSNSQLVIGETFDEYTNIDGAITYGSEWWFDNVGLRTIYTRHDSLLGRDSNTTVSLLGVTDVVAHNHIYAGNGQATRSGELTNPLFSTSFAGSTDVNLSLSNDYNVYQSLWLTTNFSGLYFRRVDNFYSNTSGYNPTPTKDQRLDNFDWQGRVGARWDLAPEAQAFANVSRSVEPPRDVDYGAGYGSGVLPRLQDQTATTIEIGARGKAGIFEGSLSVYRSWVNNELVTVPVLPLKLTSRTNNVSPTINQGIELSLVTTLWQDRRASQPADFTNGDSGGVKDVSGDDHTSTSSRLTLRQSYTYSNFYFESDPIYAHNTLPGIPPQYYQAELRYVNSTGFFAGVNTEVASSYFADYTNSLKTNAYALLGVEIGFAPPKGQWSTYLQFRNITDAHYASAVSPIYDAKGGDAPIFYPGDAFGVYGGVQVHF